ncbi:hypothetical protein BDN72DRAFT_465646 [Pluteus cervinus]|uniref:Uncharacterized protein n=1 Tax=Pluteus cervinus TaxID=181527 RepID=A0ACD3A7Q8_9AGAR|nr:hypothetical protein BDN72DRAFT_465646 [Pluteus cervinus]
MDLFGLTNDESFSRIDSEISRLQKRIWTLRNLRNTLPPISSLPNEILYKIFLINHHLNIGALSNIIENEKLERPGKSRLVLSWVSHRWREVALSYPDLWSFVTRGKVEYIGACITRSKDRYLTVNLIGPRNVHIQECFSAMHRIRSLDVNLSGTANTEQIDFRAWAQPAPHLVSLTLKTAILDADGVPTPMLSAVHGHPRLRHLALHNCGFRWDSSFLSSTLTTLHIIHPNARIAAEDLAEMLRSATSLADCKLIWCLTGTDETWNLSSGPQIYLPNLRTLTIHLRPAPLFFAFLSFLDIPNSSIDLVTHAYKFPPEYFHSTFQFLSEYWNKTIYWKYEDLRHIFVDRQPSAFNLTLSTSRFGTPTPGSPQFDMSIESENFENEAQVVAILSRYLSFERCQPVSVLLKSVSPKVVYTFSRLTSPKALGLENVRGLAESRPGSGSGESGLGDIFPQLELLEVDGESYSSFREYLGH